MKYGDLSSIVQLGVGLHVGTAVLQLYAEIGMAPMERRLSRIRDLFNLPAAQAPNAALREEFERLEARYGLFKTVFFKRYRWFVAANSIIAAILAVLLIVIACKAEDTVDASNAWFAVASIGLSFPHR